MYIYYIYTLSHSNHLKKSKKKKKKTHEKTHKTHTQGVLKWDGHSSLALRGVKQANFIFVFLRFYHFDAHNLIMEFMIYNMWNNWKYDMYLALCLQGQLHIFLIFTKDTYILCILKPISHIKMVKSQNYKKIVYKICTFFTSQFQITLSYLKVTFCLRLVVLQTDQIQKTQLSVIISQILSCSFGFSTLTITQQW